MASQVDRLLFRTALGDQLAMAVFFFGGIVLMWYELSYIAAFNHSDWSAAYIMHFLLGVFFAVNIYGNWFMLFLRVSTIDRTTFPTGPAPPGWRYCDSCSGRRPPRSHHCVLCKTCVLSRDHHCWFAGTCAGHKNQRYFFALCTHIAIAGVYCHFYNWNFVKHVNANKGTFSCMLSFIFPHLSLLMGQETLYTFWINSMTFTGFAVTVFSVWAFHAQVVQLLYGQTRYESKKNITSYGQGMWANVEEVLGCHKFLVLLCPWLTSALPGDGIHFYTMSQKSH